MRDMIMERSRTLDSKVAKANTEKAKAKERAREIPKGYEGHEQKG